MVQKSPENISPGEYKYNYSEYSRDSEETQYASFSRRS